MADAPAVFGYASDPEVTKYLAFRTLTHMSEAETFVGRCVANTAAGRAYTWLIARREGGAPIGTIELRIKGTTGDVGYAICKPWWGKGFVAEALRALITFARDQLALREITGRCDCENERSAKVFLKCGFQNVGTQKGALVHPQIDPEPRAVHCFRLLLA